MRYRKKPVIIHAVKFKGFDEKEQVIFSERPDWLNEAIGNTITFFDKPNTLTIETLEGRMTAEIGDYIIMGIQGELYPCKPDIFQASYDMILED
jgi:hypothetical protein